MSLADLHLESPRQGLRSSSHPSLLSTAALQFHQAQDVRHSWDDYHSHISTPLEDHLGDFMAESSLKEHFGSADTSGEFKGLGLDMDLDMGSFDDEDDAHDAGEAHAAREGGEASRRARTRLQSRSTKGQPYPATSPSSPGRSRSSSFRVTLPAHSPLSVHDSSPFFSSALPSPFRMPSTPTSGTMDPAHSVRSSSPSSTSSIPPSRIGSSSAASSVYGGEGGSLLGNSQTTSSSMSSAPSSRSHQEGPPPTPSSSRHRHKKSASSSTATTSPKKPRGGAGRKLTDQDRRNICRHREANPSVKQDIIAERFNIERSTVSKILKNKDHWLSIGEFDDDVFPSPPPSAAPPASPKKAATGAAPRSEASSATTTPSTPSNSSRVSRGRYPEVERLLEDWARAEAKTGTYLSDEILQAQARVIASSIDGYQTFRGSGTWIESFKVRAGITAGTFLDLHSPTSAARIQAEVDAAAADEEAGQDEDEAEAADAVEDEDDGDFDDSKASRSRKSKRQAASRRHQATPSTSLAPSELGMARTSSPSLCMDVDVKTPMHPSFDLGHDAEATPTHSTVHSRQSSKAHPTLAPLSSAAYLPSLEIGDSSASLYSAYSPYAHSQAAFAPSQDASFPLNSPFQSSGVAVPFSPYVAGEAGSGANSPAHDYHHGRSGSTASTASSYSSFSNFSSSQGGGAQRSMYGSYTTTQTTPGSLPSTPHTGYFSHGADGTQSQLQAAFLVNGQHQQQPVSPTGGNGGRRATISGGNPFHPGPVPMSRSLQSSMSGGPRLAARPTTSFDQAFASLQNVLEYLSQEGQGYITPGDLIALADVAGKMQANGSPSSGGPTHAPPQRLKFGRTQSSGSISNLGMGTRRSHSTASLLSTLDQATASQLLEEGL